MSTALLGGLTQGLGQGVTTAIKINNQRELVKARSDLFKSLAKQNEAEGKIAEARLKAAMGIAPGLFGGDQPQAGGGIQTEQLPGAAPMLGPGESVGQFPQISQAGQQEDQQRQLAALAALQGQSAEAFRMLQPQPEAALVGQPLVNQETGDAFGVMVNPKSGQPTLIQLGNIGAKAEPGQFDLQVVGDQAVSFNKTTGVFTVTPLVVDVPQKPTPITTNQMRLIAGGEVLPGLEHITKDEAANALKRAQQEKIEVAEVTGAKAQERRAQAELDKPLNVTGDLFLKPTLTPEGLRFERPRGTASVGEASGQGFLNVTGQRTAVEKLDEAQNALNILSSLEPMALELFQAEPGLGNILSQGLEILTGRLTKSGEPTNFRDDTGKQLTKGELAALYNRRLKALTRTLGRASGEKGVFTDRDVEDFKDTLPGAFDTATSARAFLSEQRRFFAEKIEEKTRNIFGEELTPPGIASQLQQIGGGQPAAPAQPEAPPAEPKPPSPQTLGDALGTLPQTRRSLVEKSLASFYDGEIGIETLREVLRSSLNLDGTQVEALLQQIITDALSRDIQGTVETSRRQMESIRGK